MQPIEYFIAPIMDQQVQMTLATTDTTMANGLSRLD